MIKGDFYMRRYREIKLANCGDYEKEIEVTSMEELQWVLDRIPGHYEVFVGGASGSYVYISKDKINFEVDNIDTFWGDTYHNGLHEGERYDIKIILTYVYALKDLLDQIPTNSEVWCFNKPSLYLFISKENECVSIDYTDLFLDEEKWEKHLNEIYALDKTQ